MKRYLGDSDCFVYHQGRFQELDSWTVGQLDKRTNGQFGTNKSSLKNPEHINNNCPTENCPTAQLQFALVNLDADLYKPTLAGLRYFYPLLSPGGVIIVHDYNFKWPGIKKATDEFVATIPESLVMVPDMEGSVMIIKSLR